MKIFLNTKSFLTFLFLTLGFFNSCKESQAVSIHEKYGDDSYYFLALQAADNLDEETAIRYFKIARSKASTLVARRSAESLTLIGNVKERLSAAKYLVDKWPDDDNEILIAAREYYRNNEFSKVISITNKINLIDAPNELVKLRFNSMIEKKDSKFTKEYFSWCVNRPLSAEHLYFYPKYLELTGIPVTEDTELETLILNSRKDFSDEQKILEFHRTLHGKKYNIAFPQVDEILEIYQKQNKQIEDTILSDIGKASFYGTDDFYRSAMKFDSLADQLEGNKKYYAYFYAARMYDKAGRYQKKAADSFKTALTYSKEDQQFDNCLWYLLDFQLRASTDDIIDTLKTYGSQIHDPDYFDDFFESLSVLLISSHKWQDFYKLWKETNSNFSGYITGKFAYISGRLIEEGLAKGGTGLKTRQAIDAFTTALSEGTSAYYKVCALERLNILDSEYVESILLSHGLNEDKKEEAANSDAGILLGGYATFGFPQKIFNEWLINRKEMTAQESINAAKFLSQCGEHDSAYNVQSLRIASWVKENTTGKLSKELIELVYPRFYKDIVSKACTDYQIPQYLMFALIRTESFFDANANSVAGAMGLTQLMETTAQEQAKKLKLPEDFDILDPETNVTIGTYYLSKLIEKAEENNKLLAVCGYNGGSANVRKWVRAAKRDWATTGRTAAKISGIPIDLWLETVPFEETRNYGKKLTSNSVLYGWLYYDKRPADLVREMFGWE